MLETLQKELEFHRQKALLFHEENTLLKDRLNLSETKRQASEEQALRFEEKALRFEEQAKEYRAEYDRAIQAFLDSQRNRFGKRSERFVDEEGVQPSLFEAPEGQDSKSESEQATEQVEVLAHVRQKNRPKNQDASLIPTREVIIEVAEEDRTCDCGCQKEVIGHETTQRLNFQPAVFEILIEKREKLACRKGCDGSPVTATLPNRILPKCKATESLLSYIAVSKVLDRQPLYHLEKSIEQRYYWRIPRNTMARWMIQLSEKLQVLVNLMKDQLIAYDALAIDATTLQVLNEPGRSPELKSYAYCVRGGPPGKEVILYEYNAYSQKDFVTETLMDFQGVIHCDASSVFNGIASKEGVTLSYCHAHARRKFEQIVTSNKKAKHPIAREALRFYQDLYKIERQAKDAALSPDERYALRLKASQPILTDFYDWLLRSRDKTLPNSPIGKAITYALNHWDGLLTFLKDGRLEIDNNATERDIKPFVIARKNFIFACTQAGADSLGVHFSLLLTAQRHGLNPMEYYTSILLKIPYCTTMADYESLLPWNSQHRETLCSE